MSGCVSYLSFPIVCLLHRDLLDEGPPVSGCVSCLSFPIVCLLHRDLLDEGSTCVGLCILPQVSYCMFTAS